MKVELIAITPGAENLIEKAGRTSYLSFDKATVFPILRITDGTQKTIVYTEEHPELRQAHSGKQVEFQGKTWKVEKRWENSAEKFIKMIIKSGHLSVLEHAYASFRIRGGSRSFTHQLVRHRMASFTQQSQRYVDEKGFQFVIPISIEKNQEAKKIYLSFMEEARKVYKKLGELSIRKEDARFVLPNAAVSEIVISANLREWRHIIGLRGDKKAQWEIRNMAIQILKILKKEVPSVFYDYRIEGNSIAKLDKI